MPVPSPTPIYRIIHIDNLELCLKRRVLYAPNFEPDDGLEYRTIHNTSIQRTRQSFCLQCGPCGVVHDYVPFYFGYLSPMMLQLKTGQVAGYNKGQEPLVYLVSTAQKVSQSGAGFVFSDGHGIAAFTKWYANLSKLGKVDWDMVYQRYWSDNVNDMDRQRRKQAEFLVHELCNWKLISEIGVINDIMQQKVEEILNGFSATMRRPVTIHRDWYYY